jgi:hypothetical protein
MEATTEPELTAEELDEERLARIRQALATGERSHKLASLMTVLATARGEFGALLKARRQDKAELLSLLSQIHGLEVRMVAQARTPPR